MKTRKDGRGSDAIRPVSFELNVQKFPEGSLIYTCGQTKVLISASVSRRVPDWMRDKGKGWVTAEYEMHPRCNPERNRRGRSKGKIDGRSQEIQRLIARSLRAAVNLELLGEHLITVDCDVLDADGGTRTASITGGCIGLVLALDHLRKQGLVGNGVLREPIAAISVGLLKEKVLLDLCYEEDRDAEVDLNVVGTRGGDFVEVQGTAEGAPVPRKHLDSMLELALASMPGLVDLQQNAIKEAGVDIGKLLA